MSFWDDVRQTLNEGFVATVADRLQQFWDANPERAKAQLARGNKYPFPGPSNYSLFSEYGYTVLEDFLRHETDLLARYADYESMEEVGELSTALDIFADDSTQPDLKEKKTVWVESKDKKIVEILTDMFKRINIEDVLPTLSRGLCKYGSAYEEPLISEEGVIGLNPLDPPNMRRIEGPKGELLGFIQDLKGRVGYTTQDFRAVLEKRQLAMLSGQNAIDQSLTPFEPYDVVHWRLQLKSRRSVYGVSVLEACRFIWKRLFLLEDSALYYRLRTAPERYAFYIDVGNLPPNEARAELLKFRQEFTKRKYVNPANGKLDQRFEALVQDEHFFLPVRNGAEAVRVETLGAPSWQCLTAETRIPLLDGTSPTIKELTDRGGDFWVYSVTPEGRLTPGRGHSARQTHESAEIFEVTLDNGQVISCTGNHPFMRRDGTWAKAETLCSGDSLMPLYRKMSSKADGDYLEGYEQVYDPKKAKYIYTHHRVFEDVNQVSLDKIWQGGSIIHHENHRKLDNQPSNLTALSRKAHAKEHAEFVKFMHTPGAKDKARASKRTPEYVQKVQQNWHSDPARQERHRARMRTMMSDPAIRQQKAEILANWNRSEARRAGMRGANHFRYRAMTLAQLGDLAVATGARTRVELCSLGEVSTNLIYRVLKQSNVSWAEFAKKYIAGWVAKGRAASALNHKVVSVVRTGRFEPVYDITVDEHHNFALEAGVIVHNSVEDIELFRDKLFAAIKIPKAYFGQEDIARASLSSQDIRFARTILRIQKELKKGLYQIADTHLAILGYPANMVDYEIHLTIPSAIYELAQLEVWNARADLAQRMDGFVSRHWILSELFGMSESEIKQTLKERSQDSDRQAEDQARAEAIVQQSAAETAAVSQQQFGSPEELLQQSKLKVVPKEMRWLWNQRPQMGEMPERVLMEGNRQMEKQLTEKIDQMLIADRKLSNRMGMLYSFLQDLKPMTRQQLRR